MHTNKKYVRSGDQGEQLFPRLPNEITFGRIVPKLPWRAFHILAAVSSAWRQAIQEHRVHDARIHSCSTDTLVVHCHKHYRDDDYLTSRIAVYSVRDRLCYELPPIPGHCRGIPLSCQCISLDGKIYVMGGAVEVSSRDSSIKRPTLDSTSKVYVLDLAGVSHWKECASMERGRQSFGCGIIDGKMYVFGGNHSFGPVRGAEVYDPKANAWSPIMPMASLRYGHKALTLGNKIVVHDGFCYDPSYTSWRANLGQDPTENEFRDIISLSESASFLEVYHPMEDVWTVDKPLNSRTDNHDYSGSVFLAQGQFHLMTEDAIYVHNDDAYNRAWTYLRSNSFPRTGVIGPIDSVEHEMRVDPKATVLVNDELLALVAWHDESDPFHRSGRGTALFQSLGFGPENNVLVWKVVSKCPGDLRGDPREFMFCVQI